MTNAISSPSPAERDAAVVSIAAALAAPFEVKDIKFKPQTVKNNRALAMAYIDARLIQDRLDRVLGVENWQDGYEILADGSVMCRLKLKLGGRWITKADVGSPSSQPDSGDRLKAAFSDALKRAAVKFGIGRYLYRLAAQWVDYDPVKKQLTQTPSLPAFAVPKPKSPAPEPKSADAAVKPSEKPRVQEAKPQSASSAPAASPPPPQNTKVEHARPSHLPINGQELHRRLQDYDAKLASQKLCIRGALLDHVTRAGMKAGYTANLSDWSGEAIPFAVAVVKEFEQSVRSSGTEHGAAA